MNLKIFPVYGNSNTAKFNMSEVDRIFKLFTLWNMDISDIFGPYELISFPLQGFYKDGLSWNTFLICFATDLYCSWN